MPSTTQLYALSLHDALPILTRGQTVAKRLRLGACPGADEDAQFAAARQDRKSTRLNSSHVSISYAVFRLKKKIRDFNYLSVKRSTPKQLRSYDFTNGISLIP